MSVKNESKDTNPYLEGRREWSERYGDYIRAASMWKIIALIASLIALIGVAGVAYMGSQNKLIPYFVAIDKIGEPVAGGYMKKTSIKDPNIIKHGLGEFITSLRTVYPDLQIQKDYVFKTYVYLSDLFPAFNAVSKFYKDHSPFKRSEDERVAVSIKSILHISDKTWQINWQETVTNENSIEKSIDKYRAMVTIAIKSPDNEKDILKNPIGLYIKDLSWSKLLK